MALFLGQEGQGARLEVKSSNSSHFVTHFFLCNSHFSFKSQLMGEVMEYYGGLEMKRQLLLHFSFFTSSFSFQFYKDTKIEASEYDHGLKLEEVFSTQILPNLFLSSFLIFPSEWNLWGRARVCIGKLSSCLLGVFSHGSSRKREEVACGKSYASLF